MDEEYKDAVFYYMLELHKKRKDYTKKYEEKLKVMTLL